MLEHKMLLCTVCLACTIHLNSKQVLGGQLTLMQHDPQWAVTGCKHVAPSRLGMQMEMHR